MREPTEIEIYKEQNKKIITFIYTPFVCSNMSCRFSDKGTIDYILNPIKVKLICDKCGSPFIRNGKDFIESYEQKINIL